MFTSFHLASGQNAPDEDNGAFESIRIKWYNNLYTQEHSYDDSRNRVAEAEQLSFLNSIIEIEGLSQHRLNFGLDFYLRASRRQGLSESPLNVLRFENSEMAVATLAHLAPKIIFRATENLTLKTSLLLPVGNQRSIAETSLPFIDNTGNQWWVQLGLQSEVGTGWFLYAELLSIYRFNRSEALSNDWFVPFKLFLSKYFTDSPVAPFVFFDYTPTLSSPTAHYVNPGGGIKIYPRSDVEVEISYSNFIAGRRTGAGYSINLGLQYKFDIN